jgi:hypothetical protein
MNLNKKSYHCYKDQIWLWNKSVWRIYIQSAKKKKRLIKNKKRIWMTDPHSIFEFENEKNEKLKFLKEDILKKKVLSSWNFRFFFSSLSWEKKMFEISCYAKNCTFLLSKIPPSHWLNHLLSLNWKIRVPEKGYQKKKVYRHDIFDFFFPFLLPMKIFFESSAMSKSYILLSPSIENTTLLLVTPSNLSCFYKLQDAKIFLPLLILKSQPLLIKLWSRKQWPYFMKWNYCYTESEM